MTNVFDGASWIEAGERMDQLREVWDTETCSASQAEPVTGKGGAEVDVTVGQATSDLRIRWHGLLGSVSVRLGSDSSKMKATGQNYSDTEAQALDATHRFWSS